MSSESPQQGNEVSLTLAAIRWYVISIEKLAADLYITRPDVYPQVKAVLDSAYRDLGMIRKTFKGPVGTALKASEGDGDGCPPGYVDCDGLCLPSCDPMNY